MSEHDLAARIGVARSTLQLIEQGNPSVAIGLVLEAAILTDVDLFVPEVKTLALQIERIEDKLALNHRPARLFAWIWLLGKTTSVVADRVHAEDNHFVFTYGCSYLAREDAIPAYAPELPLNSGVIAPEPPLKIANVLRDASPDAPKCRGIIHRLVVGRGETDEMADLDELTFMLQSGSDRIGTLDFQASPTDYVPRDAECNGTVQVKLK